MWRAKSRRGRASWVSERVCVFREIRPFRTCLLQRHIWIHKMLLYRSQRTYSAPVTIWQICCSLCHHNSHTCKMNSLLHHIKSFHFKLYGSNFMHICTLPHVTHSHQGLWVACSLCHTHSLTQPLFLERFSWGFPFLIFAPIQQFTFLFRNKVKIKSCHVELLMISLSTRQNQWTQLKEPVIELFTEAFLVSKIGALLFDEIL